jgi:hypothetical protein
MDSKEQPSKKLPRRPAKAVCVRDGEPATTERNGEPLCDYCAHVFDKNYGENA